MSFLSGFVEGFATDMAAGINKRREKAEDYFDRQLEYAQTTGLKNRQAVKESVNEHISVAKQLEASGVPKELIMAQVNQDPKGLGEFYQQAEALRAKIGRNLSAEEWNDLYKVSGDFKAPDEDIATFISRTYDPIANAVKTPGFEDSPKEGFIASLMGFNNMSRARSRLKETTVAEGLSAQELIDYGDTQPVKVGGDATVSTNYSSLGTLKGSSELTIGETTQLMKVVDENVDASLLALNKEAGLKEGEDVSALRDNLVAEIAALYPPSTPRSVIQNLVDSAIRQRRYTVDTAEEEASLPAPGEAPTEALTPPPVPEAPKPTEAAQPPSTEASDAPIDPRAEPNRVAFQATIGGEDRNMVLVRDNGDGTSLYYDEKGNEFTLKNSKIRSLIP